MSNSSYTFFCDTLTTYLPFLLGFSASIPLLIWGYLKADIPCPQVMRTFKSLGKQEEGKGLMENMINKIVDQYATQRTEAEQAEAKLVDVCLRLNKRYDYEDLRRESSGALIKGVIVGITALIVGLIFGQVLIILVGMVAVMIGILYKSLKISSLRNEIKLLNQSILFEMPILISNFAEIIPTRKKSIEDIFKDYMPQAKAVRKDLDLVLSDLKVRSRQQALTNMTARMQAGVNFEEIAQFIDLIKSDGNVDIVSMNLNKLADRIYTVYVFPYITGTRDKRATTLAICAFVALIMVFLLYTAPNLIEAYYSMQGM